MGALEFNILALCTLYFYWDKDLVDVASVGELSAMVIWVQGFKAEQRKIIKVS